VDLATIAMNLLYSQWIWVFLILPVVAIGATLRARKTPLARFVSPVLWTAVLNGFNRVIARRKLILTWVGLVLLMVAALRPQFGTIYEPTTNKGQSILIAIDTSQSMDATDLFPSRLGFAKQDLVTLMDQFKGDRVGLVTFAGIGAMQCPFTIDYTAVKLFVDDVHTGELPIPGTNLAAPIYAAIEAYKGIPGRKTLVIYSDGESFEGDFSAAAKAAKTAGIVIHAVGIGSPQGTSIPILDENGQSSGLKTDRAHQPVVTKLDESAMKAIAKMTGGRYIRATSQQAAAPQLAVLLGKAGEADYRAYLTPKHQARYMILALLAFIMLGIEWLTSAYSRRPSQ
jgi:Ca-activated chloride channel family protein